MGKIDFENNGDPTQESLDNVRENMSKAYGKGNDTTIVYNKNADAQRIADLALYYKRHLDKFPYTLNPLSKNKLNFCDTFAWTILLDSSK